MFSEKYFARHSKKNSDHTQHHNFKVTLHESLHRGTYFLYTWNQLFISQHFIMAAKKKAKKTKTTKKKSSKKKVAKKSATKKKKKR